MNKNSRGFTLIELLVVIAIIAILSVVVILTLNPAELLKQARDSNRIADMSTLKTALGQYLADVTPPVLATLGDCAISVPVGTATSGFTGANCGFTGTYVARASSSRAVDGTGWMPVNFTGISSGAPIGTLPVDPVNSGSNEYRYVASTTSFTYEIDSVLESSKQTGTTGAGATDGGNHASSSVYEVGTAPGLAL
jgi:prepilin-type N-terminal cleavage/methylation domain-containing protein